MIEQEKDELKLESKFAVLKQYQILYSDKCYSYGMFSGSIVYGVILSRLALTVQLADAASFDDSVCIVSCALFVLCACIALLFNHLKPIYREQPYQAICAHQAIVAVSLVASALGLYF